jgi:hypothetical protein
MKRKWQRRCCGRGGGDVGSGGGVGSGGDVGSSDGSGRGPDVV